MQTSHTTAAKTVADIEHKLHDLNFSAAKTKIERLRTKQTLEPYEEGFLNGNCETLADLQQWVSTHAAGHKTESPTESQQGKLLEEIHKEVERRRLETMRAQMRSLKHGSTRTTYEDGRNAGVSKALENFGTWLSPSGPSSAP